MKKLFIIFAFLISCSSNYGDYKQNEVYISEKTFNVMPGMDASKCALEGKIEGLLAKDCHTATKMVGESMEIMSSFNYDVGFYQIYMVVPIERFSENIYYNKMDFDNFSLNVFRNNKKLEGYKGFLEYSYDYKTHKFTIIYGEVHK